MDKNITFTFESDGPAAAAAQTASTSAQGSMADTQQASNASEGYVDRQAEAARKIVGVYGEALHRLAEQ